MDGNQLKEARLERNWTQKEAARALDVTQAYLSMLEKGYRPLSERFVRKALKVLHLPPTALPLRSEAMAMTASSRKRDFSWELGALGYPGFSYLPARTRRNPAQVLLEALNQPNLDARVAEGLPWLALTYVDMDWNWLVRNAKVHDRQNRLGFAVFSGERRSRTQGKVRGRESFDTFGRLGECAACARRYVLPRLHDPSRESMAARTSLTCRGTLESPDRHEGRAPCLRVRIKTFRSLGSRSCASWIHRSTKNPAGLHGRIRRQHGVRLFAPNRRPGRTGNCTEGGRQADARTRYAGRSATQEVQDLP